MKFKKQDLIALLDEDYDDNFNFEIIQDNISGKSRWSDEYTLVFKTIDDGKFYKTHYRCGATESQDESPFEYAEDEIECQEVFKKEKVIIVYE